MLSLDFPLQKLCPSPSHSTTESHLEAIMRHCVKLAGLTSSCWGLFENLERVEVWMVERRAGATEQTICEANIVADFIFKRVIQHNVCDSGP